MPVPPIATGIAFLTAGFLVSRRMRRAPLSAILRRSSVLAIAAVLEACGGATDELLKEPPLPSGMDTFDERIVERIGRVSASVREHPGNPRTWAELAIVYEVEGVRALALQCYDQAIARRPDRPKWWYRSAIVQWRLGKLVDAIRRIEASIELAPTYAPSFYRLGTFHLELGQLEDAWRAFTQATELDPDFGGGWVGRARVSLQRDQSEEAVEILEGLLQRDSNDRIVRRLLVTAYRQAGIDRNMSLDQDVGAADEETGLLWQDPWQSELRKRRRAPEMRRVTHLLRDGDPERAIRILEKRLAEEPEEADTLLHLAEAYYQEGRINKARGMFRSYLEREPDNVAARLGLARIHESEGLPHLAVEKLDEIIAIQPTYGRAYEIKGRILFENEQYDMAVPVLEQALEYDQRNPELWFWLGHSLIGLDRWEPAAAAFQSLIDQEGENGDAWLGLAKTLVKQVQLDRASAALQRADELGVRNTGMRRQVGDALEAVRARQLEREQRKGRDG